MSLRPIRAVALVIDDQRDDRRFESHAGAGERRRSLIWRRAREAVPFATPRVESLDFFHAAERPNGRTAERQSILDR